MLNLVIKLCRNNHIFIIENYYTLHRLIRIYNRYSDDSIINTYEIKSIFLKGMLAVFQLLDELNSSEDLSSNYKLETDEMLKTTLLEYNESGVISKLSHELISIRLDNEFDAHEEEAITLIYKIFKHLSSIQFVVWEGLLYNSDDMFEVFSKLITHASINEERYSYIELIFSYYINFHYNSLWGNSKSFILNSPQESVKVFIQVFNNLKKQENKISLCILLMILSVNRPYWEAMKSENFHELPGIYLFKYISKVFEKRGSNNHKKLSYYLNKTDEELVFLIVKTYNWICYNEISFLITHVDFYYYYFKPALVLFYVYHSRFKNIMTNVVNQFTYFSSCKKILMENPSIISIILKRADKLFQEIKKINLIFIQNEKAMLDLKCLNDQTNYEESNFKYKENIGYLKESKESTLSLFRLYVSNFSINLSIFCNILMNDRKLACGKLSIEKIYNQIYEYYSYLKSLEQYKDLIGNIYIVHTIIVLLTIDPFLKIDSSASTIANQLSIGSNQLNNPNMIFILMKEFHDDYNILHKLFHIFNTNLLKSINFNLNSIFEIITFTVDCLSNNESPLYLKKECFKIIHNITSNNELSLWLKMDSNMLIIDNANRNDLVLYGKYSRKKIKKLNDRVSGNIDLKMMGVKLLPFNKVAMYYGKYGVLFNNKHLLAIPRCLSIEKCFSISVRFYNPLPNTNQFHTLLQSNEGIGGLVVIDSKRKKLGCFTEEGIWIDSGIQLYKENYKNRWLNVILSYTEYLNHSKLCFYIDGEISKNYIKEKLILPKSIKYIGNCKDMIEPFGYFCDLRIYRCYIDEVKAKLIFEDLKTDKIDLQTNIRRRLASIAIEKFESFFNFNEEEELIYSNLKFLNNLISEKKNRKMILNYKIIMKLLSYLSQVERKETKKEIVKFITAFIYHFTYNIIIILLFVLFN